MIETGNHLIIQLKRNQPSLYDSVVEHTVSHLFVDEDRPHEHGKRNRIERRYPLVWHQPQGVGTEPPWRDHVRTLIRAHRYSDRFNTRLKDWEASEATAYYLCDLVLPAGQFDQATRGAENRAR